MLHTDLAVQIETLIGAKLVAASPREGGYTPALRLQCRTATTSFFVKVGRTPLTSAFVRREISVYRRVHAPFLPQLVAFADREEAPILILEDLSHHHWPPPWDERQIDLVLTQLHAMHTMSPPLESFAEVHGDRGGNWQTVAADPAPFLALGLASPAWLERALPLLMAQAAQCRTDGTSLTHWDLRSDNICMQPTKAVFVDWNLACLANPVLDLGFWLPSLAAEGGPVPEHILPHAPEVAAWVAGFFAARAGLPTIPDAPRVRWVQQQQLATALPWAIRTLELPPLSTS